MEAALFLSEGAALRASTNPIFRNPLIVPETVRGEVRGFKVLAWVQGVRRPIQEREVV